MPDLPATLDPRPAHVSPAESPGLRGLLTVAVAVVVISGLYLGRSVLIPITLAVLLSFLLAPLVNLMRRLHLGRVASALLAVLLALGVIVALTGLIGAQIADLAQNVPRYATTIEQKIDTAQQLMQSRLANVARDIEHRPAPAGAAANIHSRSTATESDPSKANAPMPVEVHQPSPTPVELAQRIIAPFLEPLFTAAIVFIVAIFILLQREDLRDRLIRLFGSSDLHRTTIAMNDAARRLSRYFLTQLAINAAFGIVIATGLVFIGIPSPVLWGILGGLLRFVPYIGTPLSAVMPLALAAAVDPGWTMLLWTAALYLSVQPVISQVVEPLLYSRSTGLSPFSVVLAATFWTWLWGPIGLILSTPLTLCLVVLGRHVARLEFLEVLLGDRPALTPVESFYQRMLAGDPDEAHDQAEILLKELALSTYYDEVALKGLRLAVVDVERGVLSSSYLERIKLSVQSLIEELDDHEDRPPSVSAGEAEADAEDDAPGLSTSGSPALNEPELVASRSATTVLCISGRGLLDDAVSTMLAQLLEKQDLVPRVVPYSATTRAAIGTLDVKDITVVCISYLELSGNPSHLRYLLRRLRSRLTPDVSVVVGLWPDEEELPRDERLRAAIGADYYTISLHDAVKTCVEIAHRATVVEAPRPLLTTVAAG